MTTCPYRKLAFYVSLSNGDNNITTATTSSKYNALSFRAISLRSSTRALHYRRSLQHSTRDLLLTFALYIHARPSPPQVVIEPQFLPISNQISLPNTPRQLLAIAAPIRTSHNVYDTLHLHIVGRHMMQVDNVQVPNICNTAPHERCPKGELLHVLARSSPDTPSTKRTIVHSVHSSYKTICPRTPHPHTFHQASLHTCNPEIANPTLPPTSLVLVALFGEGKGPGCGFKFAGSRSRVPVRVRRSKPYGNLGAQTVRLRYIYSSSKI